MTPASSAHASVDGQPLPIDSAALGRLATSHALKGDRILDRASTEEACGAVATYR